MSNTISAFQVQLRSPSLVVIGAVILTISLTYLFYLTLEYLITKYRHSKYQLIMKIIELKATNEKLQQQIARLNQEQTEQLQYIDTEEPSGKEFPELDHQKMKTLGELANRLHKQ